MSAPVDPQLAADLRDASIDGFTAQSREALGLHRDWLTSPSVRENCTCPGCAMYWAFLAGSLAGCLEGLLGVIDAADLPVGGRHEAREG